MLTDTDNRNPCMILISYRRSRLTDFLSNIKRLFRGPCNTSIRNIDSGLSEHINCNIFMNIQVTGKLLLNVALMGIEHKAPIVEYC